VESQLFYLESSSEGEVT